MVNYLSLGLKIMNSEEKTEAKLKSWASGTTLALLVMVAIPTLLVLYQAFNMRPDVGQAGQGTTLSQGNLDGQLMMVLEEAGITPFDLGPTPDPGKVSLGQALFFDKILSGNQDISCATCHHPALQTGDGLPLSFGTGGEGLGESRQMGVGRELVPRNAPDIFNRGAPGWQTMFWDGRISGSLEEDFENPAGSALPRGLDNILAAQAMFPVTSRTEMRGELYDLTLFGEQNDLGVIEDGHITVVWEQLMARLLKFPTYRVMFQEAYPEVALDELGFEHAANALAAFQIEAFSFDDSPWDRYVAGNRESLSREAKRGALLFYGKANCARCHAGNLMTDQAYHNIGAPQLGPGKESQDELDYGRFLESHEMRDLFAFRTPPLRNVALTAPWLHNGAYSSLKTVVQHHLNPQKALPSYNINQLHPVLRETYHQDKEVIERILQSLDPLVATPLELSQEELEQLMAFLQALTSPSAINLTHTIPSSVPSGLPVEQLHE